VEISTVEERSIAAPVEAVAEYRAERAVARLSK
jgi:hypothetical protein